MTPWESHYYEFLQPTESLTAPLPNECIESDSERTDLLGPCARHFVQLAALFQGKRLPLGQVELDGNSVELVTHRARDELKVSWVHSRATRSEWDA